MAGTTKVDRRRRLIRWALRLLVLVAVLWTLAAAAQLYSAKRSADAALDDLKDIREAATADVSGFVDALASEEDTVAEETAVARLDEAAAEFRSARRASRSILVSPLRALPFVGRQIRSFDALASAAASTAAEGRLVVEESSALLEAGLDQPSARLDATIGLADTLAGLEEHLASMDLGPSTRLVGPLQRAHDRFAEERDRALETVERTGEASDGLSEFLAGPSDYLLLAANNAEMQAGSGMYLQVGVLHVEDGHIEVGELVPASSLYLADPAAAIDPDVEARWGVLRPNQEWRNLNLSPRFDATATLAADMWVASGGQPVDGVLAVDIVALQALLDVTGAIEVDGELFSAENVIDELMLEQYIDFEGEQDERRDRLGAVARATFDALDDREWSPSGLLRSLQTSAEGRHLLGWSPHAPQQRTWEIAGLDGRLESTSMLLSVLNRGGNKLDQFLETSSELTVEPAVPPAVGSGGDAPDLVNRVTVEVSITNTTPNGLPRYVAGPHPQSPVGEGTYRGIVSLTVPGSAGNQRMEGGEIATLGDDGETRVLATSVVVERDATVVVSFTFDLPIELKHLVIEPGARLPATTWYYDGAEWEDEAAADVSW